MEQQRPPLWVLGLCEAMTEDMGRRGAPGRRPLSDERDLVTLNRYLYRDRGTEGR